ncbi:hypothetical protein [Rhizobium rhizoryzae]|uniref:hypothetical protein n=1 Tax=Rhizobium rhizoryzae TaxID=451876 RepID=UPI0028A18BCA|nr:hypothetical protein [Rhizobium rhizoryzae]
MVDKALAVEADALQGRLDGMGQNKARASCIAANGYQCFEPASVAEISSISAFCSAKLQASQRKIVIILKAALASGALRLNFPRIDGKLDTMIEYKDVLIDTQWHML